MSFSRAERQPVGFTEKPLASASWVAKLLPKLLQVPGKHTPDIHVYSHPENKTDEVFATTLWIPRPGNTSIVARLEGSYSPPHKNMLGEDTESISLKVLLPQQWQNHKDLPSFLEEANGKIRQHVDPKTHDDTEDPQLQSDLSVFELTDDEKKEQLYITYYYPLDIHDVPFGNRQVYLTRVVQALSQSFTTALDYLPTFSSKEIPKLVKTREKRVQTKPPGRLHTFFKNISGATLNQHTWYPPETGVEPNGHSVIGTLLIAGKEYRFLAGHEDSSGVHAANIRCAVLFPTDIQEALKSRLNGQEEFTAFTEAFAKYINTNNIGQFVEISSTKDKRVNLFLGLCTVTDNNKLSYGWELTVHAYDTIILDRAGVSQEEVLTKYLQSVHELHKHIYFFTRLNYGMRGK